MILYGLWINMKAFFFLLSGKQQQQQQKTRQIGLGLRTLQTQANIMPCVIGYNQQLWPGVYPVKLLVSTDASFAALSDLSLLETLPPKQ